MEDRRFLWLKLSPEEVLSRLRSCDPLGECSRGPYEVRVKDKTFFLNGSGFFAPSLKGTVSASEDRITCIDGRLERHLIPTWLILAVGLICLQSTFLSALADLRVLQKPPAAVTPSAKGEEIAGVIGTAGMAVGLLWMAWRPRHLRAAAYWAFLDRLFEDVKVGEEQL